MADFQIGLLDCCSDPGVCCLGCCCPCYLLALNLAQVDNRPCTCCDCCCANNPMWAVRTRIRSKYGLQFDPCIDCLVVGFCPNCSNCQHAHEMTAREGGSSMPGSVKSMTSI